MLVLRSISFHERKIRFYAFEDSYFVNMTVSHPTSLCWAVDQEGAEIRH